jgi:hypothetical protein
MIEQIRFPKYNALKEDLGMIKVNCGQEFLKEYAMLKGMDKRI